MIKELFKSLLGILPNRLQDSIRNNIINKLKNLPVKNYYKSYSQCGEDIIAQLYLSKQKGFYVDVGAFHPIQISNTYLFKKKGWKGINVDGTSSVITLFNKFRPHDINVHACVGLNDGETVTYYKFKSGALNTFKKEKLEDIKIYHHEIPISEEKIKTRSLSGILNEHMEEGREIDLMSIDVEGADEEVLQSNDWTKYNPKVIIIEHYASIQDFLSSNIYLLLSNKNYLLGGFSRHSFIFYRKEA